MLTTDKAIPATWTFKDGAPNTHSRQTCVVTTEQLRRILAEQLEYNRGQEIQVVIWDKTGLPMSYWLTRAEARKLIGAPGGSAGRDCVSA